MGLKIKALVAHVQGWLVRMWKKLARTKTNHPNKTGASTSLTSGLVVLCLLLTAISISQYVYTNDRVNQAIQSADQLFEELNEAKEQLAERGRELDEATIQLKKDEELLQEMEALKEKSETDDMEIEALKLQVEEQAKKIARMQAIPTGKKVYLTFDDGPSVNTLAILDVLAHYNVKATFFVINTGKTEYMKKIVDSGNAIALHTHSHNYEAIYANEEAFWADWQAIHDLVLAQTGVDTRVFRFPGGSSNRISAQYNEGIMTRLTEQAAQKGRPYFDWNTTNGDAESKALSPAEMIYRAKLGAQKFDSVMLLMHDSAAKTITPQILPEIIEYYQSEGYAFCVIDEHTPPVHQTVKN